MAARPFRVVALRGDAHHAPENTFPAFEAALDLGADELATDIRATKDGAVVLCRDASLFRTTGREALVKDLTLKEIQELSAGMHHDAKYREARVPALEEFVSRYVARAALQVEIVEPAAVLPTLQVLQRFAEQGAFERTLAVSLQRKLLASLRVLDARVRLGYLLDRHSTTSLAEVKHFGASVVLSHWEEANKGFVDDAHKLGLQVQVWGLESLEGAKQALAAGADSAAYDHPAELLAHLKEAGLRANGSAVAAAPASPPAKTPEAR